MSQQLIDIFLRTVVAFLLLFLVARVLGKQMISNMTFHDFVSGITLGGIAANLAFNKTISAVYITLSLIVFAGISLLTSEAALKSRKWRKWVSGSPTVFIENGKILEENMRKARYTLDSLNQTLREKDIFDIEEVEFAVLEDFGKLSIKKKELYENVTRKDLHLIMSSAVSFPVELIMDGEIIVENVSKNGLSVEWLHNELRKRGKTVAEVFYAVKGTKEQLIFDYYKDGIEQAIQD